MNTEEPNAKNGFGHFFVPFVSFVDVFEAPFVSFVDVFEAFDDR